MDDTNNKKDILSLPSPEKLREIAVKQDERAKEIKARRAQQLEKQASRGQSSEQQHAAEVIQRNYRGYRDRRALNGYGLDPSTRWIEAIKEAKYHNVTSPRSRAERTSLSPGGDSTRERWRKLGAIAQRAGSDDTSESESEAQTDEQLRKIREHKRAKKAEREKYAKVMGLEYFLEMVDQKHRYGSNLRRYHQEWKKSETQENYFYWLDYGEGKHLDLEDRPRKRLDFEQVRYLSREDRLKYLVEIKQGRFCWVKNEKPVTTSIEFKDSINGIVPVHDDTPTWREVTTGVAPEPPPDHASDDSDDSSILSTGSQEDASKYTNQELHDAKGLAKLNHISVDSVMNHLLRKTTKKNTWIFVADTSMRLYIGIKQSGAFQHSSFLHGARVSSAGLIEIKRGELRKLSPLSGHYAPPVQNFRMFVRSLKEAGADLSHCSISRSYAVLLGLDGYLGAKKHVKLAEQTVKDMLDPEAKKKREEAETDKSKSAQREREYLQKMQEQERKRTRLSMRLKKKFHFEEDVKAGGHEGGVKGRGADVKTPL
ncbi:hypothetical protein LTR56_018787 [Elasticomyces elasticus]|nr:hypothetical protein LTR56_018787 [Elasticomyces elasticus]KAK3635756.1 hypothetical protein LTR22_019036 [Elasticomyces elasticus]KAK4911915.1 hypothetical protein LTR49_019562 [Elasticomyces elasticus]KAK5743036.1 hypothetical protein LTS12_023992 [Elasticomyces elasticus]